MQSHRTTIAECAVLGLCLESPIATVIAAAQTAHDAGVTVLLNGSPFMDELPHELVEATDILLVNQHEVAQLLGLPDDGRGSHSTGMRSPNDSPITDSTGR